MPVVERAGSSCHSGETIDLSTGLTIQPDSAFLSKKVRSAFSAAMAPKLQLEEGTALAMDKVGLLSSQSGEKTEKVKSKTLLSLAKRVNAVTKILLGGLKRTSRMACSLISRLKYVDVTLHALTAFSLPLRVHEAVQAPFEVIRSHAWRDRVFAAFNGIEAWNSLVSFAATTCRLLYDFGKIGVAATNWTRIAGPIMSALGVVSLASNALGLRDTYSLRKKLNRALGERNKEGQYTQKQLREALELLLCYDSSRLKRNFSLSYDLRQDARVALSRIYRGDARSIEQASNLMDQLKTRISAKMRSHTLKAVSASLSLVALPLLMTTPAAVVGTGLISLSAGIGLATAMHDLYYFTKSPQRFQLKGPTVIQLERALGCC